MSSQKPVWVDAVLVAYNGGTAVREAVVALLANINVDVRVIVVDNGSDPPVAVELEGLDVRLISLEQNVGYGAAANIGVEQCESTWIAICNQDIVPAPDCLSVLVAAAQTQEESTFRPTVAGPKIVDFGNTALETCHRIPSLGRQLSALLLGERFGGRNFSPTDTSQVTECGWVSAVLLVMRAETFGMVGGFDGKYFMYVEDVDFFVRLAEQGGSCIWVPGTLVRHDGGVSTSNRRPIPGPLYSLALTNWQSFFRSHGKHLPLVQGDLILSAGILGSYARALAWWCRSRLADRQADGNDMPDIVGDKDFPKAMATMFAKGATMALYRLFRGRHHRFVLELLPTSAPVR